ncbi:MAG: FecR domain-containing protein [Polyangiaceae bacterium]
MNTLRYASAAAKLLAKHLQSVRNESGDRERGVATIERALVARRRRLVLKWQLGAVAAAAALVLVVRVPHWLNSERASASVSIDASPAGRGAALGSGNQALPMPPRAELEPGQRIETPPEGGASLRLSTGTAMDLSGRTAFRVDGQGVIERFSLQQGELKAHVAKLAPGHRFIIATPDTEIEVRGTRFRLRVLDGAEACGAGSRTRLEVSEGLVEVRSAGSVAKIPAGAHWPADCTIRNAVSNAPSVARETASAPPSPLVPADVGAAVGGNVTLPAIGTKRRTPGPLMPAAAAPAGASSLSDQNDLFAEGVALRRQGDAFGAIRAYAEFMRRFPNSPLSENALAERMRLLTSKQDPRSSAEAERYLARYPNGFAAQEARQIAARP